MSGGGFHSPRPDGDFEALKAYAKAMFSGENLPHKLEGEQPEFSDALAEAWAKYSPQNEPFMRGLDPQFQTVNISSAAFPEFPGAAQSGYSVVQSAYAVSQDEDVLYGGSRDAPKNRKQAGEAFHACLLTGIQAREVPIHYDTVADSLIVNGDGAVTGVEALRGGQRVTYHARRAVIFTCGGYEYNMRMRKAFLEGPGIEGWAFYGTPANTGDGIRMALKVGAALAKIGSIAGRVICAIPERRLGIKIGLNTSIVGKPNEMMVDNHGRRYAAERRITKDPSRYIFYKEALLFDTSTLTYPRIPSWMIFDSTLMKDGPPSAHGCGRLQRRRLGQGQYECIAQRLDTRRRNHRRTRGQDSRPHRQSRRDGCRRIGRHGGYLEPILRGGQRPRFCSRTRNDGAGGRAALLRDSALSGRAEHERRLALECAPASAGLG